MSCMKDMLRFRANSRSCPQGREKALKFVCLTDNVCTRKEMGWKGKVESCWWFLWCLKSALCQPTLTLWWLASCIDFVWITTSKWVLFVWRAHTVLLLAIRKRHNALNIFHYSLYVDECHDLTPGDIITAASLTAVHLKLIQTHKWKLTIFRNILRLFSSFGLYLVEMVAHKAALWALNEVKPFLCLLPVFLLIFIWFLNAYRIMTMVFDSIDTRQLSHSSLIMLFYITADDTKYILKKNIQRHLLVSDSSKEGNKRCPKTAVCLHYLSNPITHA